MGKSFLQVGIRIAAIGSDNCNGKLPCVEEREGEQKIRAQIGLKCTRKQVSSKFITSLLLAILEGGQRRKVCVDCFSNMSASDLMKKFNTRDSSSLNALLHSVCGFCHPFSLVPRILFKEPALGHLLWVGGWIGGWVGRCKRQRLLPNQCSPLDVLLGWGQRTGLFYEWEPDQRSEPSMVIWILRTAPFKVLIRRNDLVEFIMVVILFEKERRWHLTHELPHFFLKKIPYV